MHSTTVPFTSKDSIPVSQTLLCVYIRKIKRRQLNGEVIIIHCNNYLSALRVFENRALKRILGPNREEVTGEWRKLHNEVLNDLYSPPNIVRVIKSRRMRWARHVARMRERRGVYRGLVGKPEGKRPRGRPWRRWEDNIKMDLQEVGWEYGLDRAGSG